MNIALIASGTLISKKEATYLTLLQLAKEFQKQHHTVVIIAKKHHSLPERETIDNITIYRRHGIKNRIPSHLKNLWAVAQSLTQLKQEQNFIPDIIHGFASSPLLALELKQAKRIFPNAKTIYTWKSYSKYPITQFLLPLLNNVDYITAPANTMIKRIHWWGIKKEKTSLIHSNINCERFKPRNKEELKKKYSLEGKKVILYYGALRKQKGADYLIKALPKLIQKHQTIKTIFAVRSREEAAKQKYLDMAKKYRVQQYIEITLEDLPIEEYVSMADVVVLAYPSLIGTEGNPSCLLESMASKTPVVTTMLPELKEILTPGQDVLMGHPKDINALAKNILRIFENQELVQKLTENAYQKALAFDTKQIAKEYLELYEKEKKIKKH